MSVNIFDNLWVSLKARWYPRGIRLLPGAFSASGKSHVSKTDMAYPHKLRLEVSLCVNATDFAQISISLQCLMDFYLGLQPQVNAKLVQ